MKAILKQVKSGENKGKYRFELYGVNGEKMSVPREYYDDVEKMRQHVMQNFPNFEIVNSVPEEEEEEEEVPQAPVKNPTEQPKTAPKKQNRDENDRQVL